MRDYPESSRIYRRENVCLGKGAFTLKATFFTTELNEVTEKIQRIGKRTVPLKAMF